MSTDIENTALSAGDRWKRYWYLGWVDTWLWTMPRRRRKAVLAELKQNLSIAAADDGMDAAIDQLGRPRALATQYLEGEPRQGPLWTYGFIAALIVFFAWVYATTIYVFGSLDALSAASVNESVDVGFLGLDIVAESSDSRLGATFSGFSWPALTAVIVGFLLFARVWRLGRRRR